MGHGSVDELLATVGQVYAGAAAPDGATGALRAMRGTLDGFFCQSLRFERSTRKIVSSTVGSDVELDLHNEYYAREWGHRDPRNRLLSGLGSLSVIRCHEAFDESYVARSEFHQEYLIPTGIRWGLGGAIHFDDGTTTVIAAARSPDQRCFSAEDAGFLKRLLPHFQRAELLAAAIRAGGTDAAGPFGVEHLLARSSLPCWLLDPVGRLKAAQSEGMLLFNRIAKLRPDGGIRFSDSASQQAWERCLREVLQARLASDVPIRGDDGSRWCAHVVPCGHLQPPSDTRVAQWVLVTLEQQASDRPATASPNVMRFAAAHGLTRAERDVLELLGQGLGPKQIAERRRASLNTVRSQLASLREKSGCRSQRELLTGLARA